MSLAAVKIVKEEFKRRRDSIPDIHCAHDRLNTLEALICERIMVETVEIPEEDVEDQHLWALRSVSRL